ncbi:MAG: hypothetical protein SGJ00_01680 [bacterium]|nr:hypothetical protein [bacterium]
MKKGILMFAMGLFILGNTASCQIGGALDKLNKQSKTAAADAQKASTASILSNLDAQLKSQFKLDGVKSQIMGDALKIKVADSDFNKLSATSKTKQGNEILGAASSILSGSGLNLKGLGIGSIILEMVKSMSLSEILQTFKKKI